MPFVPHAEADPDHVAWVPEPIDPELLLDNFETATRVLRGMMTGGPAAEPYIPPEKRGA
ncbi:hypothetical protein ACIBG7_18525 [Nonomuraea sp. NPDC050328]|uniref:hypothetical protein n=1 Tax=Nonomuraea sp. NPDC050328 TaxID=3364361 RepID=UPI00378874B6